MKYRNLILLSFVALKFLLQLIAINPLYELHRDEYLHLDLGNHLAWGYISVPPFTAALSFFIISMGKSVFWIKFFPVLFGALTMVVVWKTVEALGGQLFALSLSALCVTLSALLRVNILYQPNSFEYLVWTTVFFCIIRFIQDRDEKWLWYTGFAFAVGFLNKYNISFLFLGLFPAMMLSKQRRLFREKILYKVLVVSLLLISPNIWWQYQNGFPVIWHLKTLSSTQLVNVDRMQFIKDQFLFFAGGNLVILASFISFFRFRPFRKFKVIFLTCLFVLLIYFYLKAKSYYAIGLYPVLIAFGSVYLEYLLDKGWKFYLRPVFLLIPIIVIMPIFNIVLPVLSPSEIIENPEMFRSLGLLRWEDGKDHPIPQDFADMQGWRELSALTDKAFDQVSADENTLIHCDNYGMAGAINFYSKRKSSEALSLNADYIKWYPSDDWSIDNVILVQESRDDDPERKREASLFESITLIGEIKNEFAREKGTKVYLLQGSKKDINAILKEEIRSKIERMHY